MKKVVSVLLFVVAIAMIGSGVYIMNSSKYLFSTVLDGVFNYMTDEYVEMSSKINRLDKYKITTNTSFSNNNEEIISITGDIYSNIIDKKSYINLDSKFKGKDFVGIEQLLDEEKIYIKLKEVMEDFYYMNLDEQIPTMTDSFNTEDYQQLLKLKQKEVKLFTKHLKSGILKNLTNKDFKKTSETLTIEGKNYKVSKISLELSEKKFALILKSILEEISKDSNAIKIIQKINKNITAQNIKDLADNINIEDLSDDSPNQTKMIFSFYIENFTKLRRFEIRESYVEVDSIASNNTVFRIDLLEQDSFILSYLEGVREVLKIKMENISKTQSKISFEMEGGYAINGTFNTDEKNTQLNLNFIAEGKTVTTVLMKRTILTKNKEYKVDLTVEIPDMEMKFISQNTFLSNENIPNIDISSAKDIKEMSEEEQKEYLDYIEEKMSELVPSVEEDDDI